MAAITWRNVDSGSLGNPTQTMALGGATINAGFDKLGELLKQREAVDESNWKVGQETLKQNFMDALYKAKTPEELAALQSSGALDQFTQGMAPEARAATRTTLDARPSLLQNREVADITHKNTLEDAATAGLKEQLKVAIANQDSAEIARLNPLLSGKRGSGDLALTAETQRQAQIRFGQQMTEHGQKLQEHEQKVALYPGALEAQKLGNAHVQAQNELLAAQKVTEESKPRLDANKLFNERLKVNLENFHATDMYGSKNGYSPDPAVNASNISDVIHKTLGKGNEKAAGELAKIFQTTPTYRLKDAEGKLVDVGIPPAAVRRAIEMTGSGAKDGVISWFDTKGYGEGFKEGFKSNLDKLMNDPQTLQSYTTLNQLTANQQRGKPASSEVVSNTKQDTPSKQDAPTAALEAAAAKVATQAKGQSPTAVGEVTQGGKDRKALLEGLGLVADGITLPGRAISDTVGLGVNASSRLFNALMGNDVVPPYQSSIGTQGFTPFYNMAKQSDNPKNVEGVTNAPVQQPKVSAPIASNIGQAPVKAQQSSTVINAPDGSQTPTEPFNPTKAEIKSLGKPVEIVSAYKGAIPKGQGTKVVATVLDGDTLAFNPADPTQKVPGAVGNICRFDLIDAPETGKAKYGKQGQPYGPEAADYLRQMIENKEVTIRVTDQAKRKDGSSRNLCQVEFEGKAIDLEMVKAGFAMVYSDYVKGNVRGDALNAGEATARTNQLGQFTGGRYAEPPNVFRRRTEPQLR